MARIYTRSGDQGNTGLANSQRVGKDTLRIEAIGTVDECNAHIGLLLAHLPGDDDLRPVLEQVQHHLFDLGAALATAESTLSQADVDYLEKQIDHISEKLSPLKHFILPGGNIPAATAHMARTVCRRAERCMVALSNSEAQSPKQSSVSKVESELKIPQELLRYINRLSDLLFSIARVLSARNGGDIRWTPNSERAHPDQS